MTETQKKKWTPSSNSEKSHTKKLLNKIGEIELWHTPTSEAWATVWNGKGYANYALSDPRFETWLVYRCLGPGCDSPSRESMGKLLSVLRARAIFEGAEHKVHIRVAGSLAASVYIDLGRPDWKALELTAEGWEVVDQPPVKFRRGIGMRPLPMPDPEGSVGDGA